jgi:glucose/arabinose dehydrogenase
MSSRRTRWSAALVAIAVTVAAGGSGADATTPIATAPIRPMALPFGFTDTPVASVDGPTTVKTMPDGTVAVLGKAGAVRFIVNGVLSPTVALQLDLAGCTNSERGLLGIAADPAYTTNGHLFLYYTQNRGSGCVNRVARFTKTGATIAPTPDIVLLDNIPSTGGNHNGGDLEVGKDGFLYVAIGDAGTDPRGNSGSAGSNDAARDLSLLVGKIARIDRTTGAPAPGNPYLGAANATDCRTLGTAAATNAVCREIYASGLRNPYRIAFDPNATGTRFFINDVGQGTREEVNEGLLGADYGWPSREGRCPQGQNPPCAGPPAGLTDPITDYGRGEGQYITAGGFVPNGSWPSQYDGAYVFGDGGSGRMWVRFADGSVNYADPFHETGELVDLDFAVESGGLSMYYVLSRTSTNSVRKITFPTQPPPTVSNPLRYEPFPPGPFSRAFDSRSAGTGAPIPAQTERVVTVRRTPGARAVLANVAFLPLGADGFATAWAADGPRPSTAVVNARAGEAVSNASVVPLDPNGQIRVFSNVEMHIVIDVFGEFFDAPGAVTAGRFEPLPPSRLIDTREPVGPSNQFVRSTPDPNVPIDLVNAPVVGRLGVPTGVQAVALTVTGLSETIVGGGYVAASPGGGPAPVTANANTNGSGDIRPNLVVIPVGANGSIDLRLFRVANVVVDITGYFTGTSAPSATSGRFRSLSPYREVDTRTPFGFSPFGAGSVRVLNPVSIPTGAAGISQNLTIVDNATAGFITSYPSEPRPFVSSGNTSAPDQIRGVATFVPLAADGTIRYFSLSATDLVVDVTGYFEG